MAGQSNETQKQVLQSKVVKQPQTLQKQPQISQEQSVLKKKKSCWTIGLICCGSCCVALLLVFLVVLGAVAATGVYNVPVLSDIIYKEPQPIRKVTYSADTIKNFNQRLDNEAKSNPSNQSIVMTESELTVMLNQDSNQQNLQSIQAAITPDFIELYIKFPQPSRLVVVANVVPVVESGQFRLNFTKAKVGPFNISQSQLTSLTDSVNQNISKNFSSPANNTDIINVKLKNKEMIIYFRPTQVGPVI